MIVGGVWMARFESLTSGISPDLYKRLQTEYASNEGNFRHLFDELQVSRIFVIKNNMYHEMSFQEEIIILRSFLITSKE